MPTSKLTLVNQRTQQTSTVISAAQTPINQRALNTLQAVRAWQQFEQRLSDDDRALLDRIAMGDCIKSASNHVGMTYANAQRRLLRLQERMGVRSLPLLIWVWRTVTQQDHADAAEQMARDATPTLVEHARDIARFVKSKPENHDTNALHTANINNDDLITLLESRMRDGDTAAMSEFVVSVSMSLPSLLSSSEADFEMAVRAARVIAAMEKPEPVGVAIHVLLDVGYAHVVRGISYSGVFLVERALALASQHTHQLELRRACSVYAALSVDVSMPARAVDYALRAAKLANELNQPVNVVTAFINMTAALFSMGLYLEVISVGLQVIRRYGALVECAVFVGGVRANVANAGAALRKYTFSVETAKEACQAMGLPHGAQDVLNRIAAESVWLKSAIALKQDDVVELRLKTIHILADSFRSPRVELNRKLSEAANKVYVGDLTGAVIVLLSLKQQTKPIPALYYDNLALLIQAYEKGNDHAGVMQCLVEMVDFSAASQISKVRALAKSVCEKAQPQKPIPHSVRTIVEEIQSATPRKSLANIESSESMYRETFERLAISAELRDDIDTENLGRHAYRVGALAGLLAARAGHDDQFVQSVALNARLHDIGKLCIPENILTKTEKLTDAEFAAIQRHTSVGAQILSQCRHPAFRLAEAIAQCHHEKWDGSGYPRGLKGDAIPEAARIVALADVYDTLTHVRPYKRAWTHKAAITEIQKLSGTHFDPTLVDRFIPMLNQLRKKFPDDAFDKHLSQAGNESEFLQARDRIHEMLAETETLLAVHESNLHLSPSNCTLAETSRSAIPRV
jgi:putative two-component system response regulator